MITRRPSSTAVIAITGAALFMIVLDNLIVASTLPTIGRDLDASLTQLEWVVNAYILSFAVLMLTGAALGERFGRRRVFTAGLVVFSLASLAGGLAPSGAALVAARVAQGAGAAVLMPLSLTLLSAAFPPERRGTALGVWSAIAGLGVALGPIAGGLLTTGLSWHWIFWVNVPVGLAAAVLAPRFLEESFGRREPVDVGGLALGSAALFALVWTTVRGNDAGWDAPATLLGYGTAAFLGAGFVAWERRRAHAMLPLRLFSNRVFSMMNVAGFLLHFAMFGAFFMVVQFLAHARGDGPVTAGLWTLPWTLMPLVVSPLAARLGKRVAPALLVALGLGLVGAGALALGAVVGPGVQETSLVLPLWAIGVGVGLVLPNLVALAMGAAPAADLGKASGTLNTARQLGSVFGVAVAVAAYEAAGSSATPAATSAGAEAGFVVAAVGALVGAAAMLTIAPRPSLARVPAPAR
jgi:EmrB/QacA subfamily drug resistance transporter